MVMRLLRLGDPPRPADSADALALAICHLWRGAAEQRLAAAVRKFHDQGDLCTSERA
jgi:crossover junction endodeoxyribonuclease RuvC